MSQSIVPADCAFPSESDHLVLPSAQQAASVADAAPSRKREKSMSRRPGQSGRVVKKGNWWYGRMRVDVPGEEKRKRLCVKVGQVDLMTESQANRKWLGMVHETGINRDDHLDRLHLATKTFAEEADWWKANRLSLFKPSCQENMGRHVERYLRPRFGKLPVSTIDERQVQEFVADLNRTEYVDPAGKRKRLSPSSIRGVITVLKLILGKKVWRDWNLRLPELPENEQRYFTPEEMVQIINAVKGANAAETRQWRTMFAALSGTGLRCGEIFGLHVADLDLEAGRIVARRSVWEGEEVTLKTKKSRREVDIEPLLVEMLKQHLNGRTTGRVFRTKNDTPFNHRNVRRKLRSVLKQLGLKMAGLHAFRHGRVSVLQENKVPGDLILRWVGHSNLRTTGRYSHFSSDFRQQEAVHVAVLNGVHFGSKSSEVGPNGPKKAKVEQKGEAA